MVDKIQSKTEYALKALKRIKNNGYTSKSDIASSYETSFSRSTEYRILKELREAGYIEKKRKQYKLTKKGHKYFQF